MAQAKTRNQAQKTARNVGIAAARQALLEAATTVPQASAAIDASFKEDAKIQKVYSKHIAARAELAIPNALRAEAAFKAFRPSQFTKGEREPRRYLAPGENLSTTLTRIVHTSVDRMRDDDNRRGLRIELTKDFKKLLNGPDDDDADADRTVELPVVLEILSKQLPLSVTLRDDPALTECAALTKVQERLDEIEGKAEDSKKKKDKKDEEEEPEPGTAKAFVSKHVRALLAHVPSPEEPPVLVRPAAADDGQVRQNIQNFELRSGPSDVTSYHDFNNLQIAFEHVWAEVFDDRLTQLGREFYNAYVDVLEFVGNPINPETGEPIVIPPPVITSIADITNLMQNASMLGRVANNATPSVTLSADFMTGYNYTRQNFIKSFRAYAPTEFTTEDQAAGLVDGLMVPLKKQVDLLNTQTAENQGLAATLPVVTRLQTLLKQMRDMLGQPYAFTVYKEKSCNFGILVTYRQTWVPEQYQVGDLVSTIPLAPKETRRYTTKQVTKRTRAVKEIANNLNSFRTDMDTTGRADRDIVNRAENRTNFKTSADGTFGTEPYKIHATAEGGVDSSKISESTKKDFHEAVLKSAREYKQENRTEVDTSTSEETETTTYHEIQNPNDELTVTYLFYELQRTYHISEHIHQVTPVVLVANKVPAPHEIDDAWLIKHDWILRRVLLDDSFRPGLEYLTKSFVGDELNLQVLDNNVRAQKQVVETVKAQVAAQLSMVAAAQGDLKAKMDAKGALQLTEGYLSTIKNIFDPFKLTGQSVLGTNEGMDTISSYAQETLDRTEREKARLLDQLGIATTALQTAVDKLAAAIREHYDKIAEVDRVRLHVKENILYYMQAIWNHEPPDQRYFRVFETQVPVPVPVPNATNISVPLSKPAKAAFDALRQRKTTQIKIPLPEVEINWKPLVEVADLDEVLGYKGNYAIYRLKENNCLTLHMMQDYLEFSDTFTIRDPDDFSNYSVAQLQELATCLYTHKKEVYEQHKKDIKQWMFDRLISGRAEDDRVIVPTKSLYVEALVGTHPLLEDFKLLHRALDVKKAQGEVRHAELENVRLAARALANQLEDPDIEKKVVVEARKASVTVQPET